MDVVLQSIILFLSGLVAGTYGSVVGGGSLVSFPVMILLGIPVDIATGTNRFNAIFMEASSLFAFARKKLVQWKLALPIAILSIPASIWGASIAIHVEAKTLNIIVAVILGLLLFCLPYVKPQQKQIHENTGKQKLVFLYIISIFLAIYAGFHGAAYGTFILFPFLLLGTSSLLNASANARLIGLFASIAASIVFIQNGSVDFAASWPQIAGSVIGAQIGVNTAVKHLKLIKYILSIVVVGSIIKLILETF